MGMKLYLSRKQKDIGWASSRRGCWGLFGPNRG